MDDLHRRHMVPTAGNSASLVNYKSKVSLNDAIIDGILRGGFTTKEVSELVGEASSGKTQLCLHLLVQSVCSPSGQDRASPSEEIRFEISQKAVYFYTEGGDIPLDRLQNIAMKQYPGLHTEILDNIYTEHSFESGDDLFHRLLHLEDLLIRSETVGCPVKLMVVDSIAFLFKDIDIDDVETAPASRSVSLFKISSLLKRYADIYDLAIVVTNHVVDLMPGSASTMNIGMATSGCRYMESFPGCAGLELMSSGKALYPALGLAWSSCINARFFISKESMLQEKIHKVRTVLYREPSQSSGLVNPQSKRSNKGIIPQVRGLQIVFSPDLPQTKAHFIIHEGGCSGVSNDIYYHQ